MNDTTIVLFTLAFRLVQVFVGLLREELELAVSVDRVCEDLSCLFVNQRRTPDCKAIASRLKLGPALPAEALAAFRLKFEEYFAGCTASPPGIDVKGHLVRNFLVLFDAGQVELPQLARETELYSAYIGLLRSEPSTGSAKLLGLKTLTQLAGSSRPVFPRLPRLLSPTLPILPVGPRNERPLDPTSKKRQAERRPPANRPAKSADRHSGGREQHSIYRLNTDVGAMMDADLRRYEERYRSAEQQYKNMRPGDWRIAVKASAMTAARNRWRSFAREYNTKRYALDKIDWGLTYDPGLQGEIAGIVE